MSDSINSVLKKIFDLFGELGTAPEADRILLINEIRIELHKYSPMKDHPIDLVLWVHKGSVQKNDYNPNSVAPKELELLETSIYEDGYTQPIVTWNSENGREIIDGFHRYKIAMESKKIEPTLIGYIPVTTVRDRKTNKSNRMASTIRHNRARGTHSIDAMSEIVLELKSRNWKTERICRELGMEEDEVLRLCQITGLAGLFSDTEFTQAWESDVSSSDSELDLSSDFNVITQNTNDKNRIFHTFDKWESVPAGFFSPGIKGKTKDECESEYAAFLSDLKKFEKGIIKVFNDWPNSCEHNLTNSSMNRIAWIGQAAACISKGLPSTYRSGFSLLSKDKQKQANDLALKYLNMWLKERGMSEVTEKEAMSDRASDLF